MKAYLINATTKTVQPVEYEGIEDIRKILGGEPTIGKRWENGDMLLVDDHGPCKYHHFFALRDADSPFIGNGLVIGRGVPNTPRNRAPTIKIPELTSRMSFFHRVQISAQIGYA